MRTVFRCATALLLGGVVACQGGVQSGVRPPVVTPPAPTPPRAAPIAWRARYDATPTSYRVRVETRLARDSAGQREEAPVTTTARVTLSWPAAGGGAARRV
ncbi:MAG: hypothetical protein MUE41_04425, partial [Gemmatimonadaceae bacterium]|nr:hypothetical protein [Gemmatimonadaceae bacterium]